LKKAKSSRTQSSLKAIDKTCTELFKSGSTDFSIASIARAGELHGVPKAQSIRNSSGCLYRELISAWKAECGGSADPSGAGDWISRIEDANLRYLTQDLLIKKQNLESEIRIYRSIKVLEIDMRERVNEDSTNFLITELINSERDALEKSVDEAILNANGLKSTERGAVVDEKGSTVFERGFLTAIRKIIASYSD